MVVGGADLSRDRSGVTSVQYPQWIGSNDVRATRYVIIGAGFAGAATAYHLARRGAEGILVLEQEPTAGAHSSGRNAAMVRQIVSDEAVGRLPTLAGAP